MTNNKKIKIILPSIILLAILAVVLVVVLIPKSLTPQDYFNSLQNSNYTKQVQLTTITEDNVLVYQKRETVVYGNNCIYHNIEEKSISASAGELYDEVESEYYYTNSKIYYKENDVWKSQDFNYNNNLKKYNLKTEFFVTFEFDKKIETQGTFNGQIKDQNANDALASENNYTSVGISIVINASRQVQNCSIGAKTQANRDVLIFNTFTYNQEFVTLPE